MHWQSSEQWAFGDQTDAPARHGAAVEGDQRPARHLKLLGSSPRAEMRARTSIAKPPAEYVSLYTDREKVIAAAYASGGYTLKAIVDHFGLLLRKGLPYRSRR